MIKIFLFCCTSFLLTQEIFAQVSGVRAIPGDYASITEAVQQIKTSGVSGPVFLELQTGYNSTGETFPIKIREIPGSSAVNSITISPAAGATSLSIISSNPGSVIDLIGAYNIIIDGRPGRTGSAKELTIRNNSTAGKAISFLDGAVGNSVAFCRLEASGMLTTPGLHENVVYFGRSTEPLPVGVLLENTNNTISNCIVSGINSILSGIYAEGTSSVQNAANKIIDNEILQFYKAGIFILEGSNWTITGNSIYNSLDPGYESQTAIRFSPGQASVNDTISGNFIGGQAPRAGGEPWTISGGASHTVLGINGISIAAGSVVVENNIIQNIRVESNNNYVAYFWGIWLTEGTAQIKGNLIGGTNETNGISLDGGGNIFFGIIDLSCSGVSIENNRISNITLQASIMTATSSFNGIEVRGGSNVVITGNQVDQVTANSIGAINFTVIGLWGAACPVNPQPAVLDHNLIKNIKLSSAQDSASFTGIKITGISTEPLQLHNNGVSRINVSSSESVASFAGTDINERIALNTGNIIGSATEANSIMVTGKSAFANGIRLKNSPDVSINDDIIANITAIGTINPASVNGIIFEDGALAKIAGNKVHHLTASATNGIFIQPTTGSSVVTLEKNILTGVNTSTGIGIKTFVASEASLNLIATDNAVSNWQTGVLLTPASGATLQQTFQNNAVVANQTGFINNNGAPVNATCNWWGDASGPGGAGPGTGNPVGPNVIFSPWATISTYVAVNAGPDQTIAGSGSKTLTPVYTVCGTATYLWSTGATTPSITVSPAVTTVYSIRVTDANGHEATDEVTVVVQNVGLPKISILNTVVIEGNSGTNTAIFILYLNKVSAVPVTVHYQTSDITAITPQDYVAKSGNVTFPANNLIGLIQTITIQVKGDLLAETDETFNVQLSNAVNATISTASATCTIVDNDPPCLRINDTTATENSQQAIVRVSLSTPSSRIVKVKFDTKDGTAKAPEDYVKVSNSTLTFQPGETTKNITIVIKQDALNNEPTEKFQVILKDPENANIGTTSYCTPKKDATVSILNSAPEQNREVLTKTQLIEKEETLDITVPGILRRYRQLTIHGLKAMDNDLMIFDCKGIAVAKFRHYKNTWSPGNITTGIYFYQLRVKSTEGEYKVYRGKILITD